MQDSSRDSFGLQTELLVGLAELGDVRAIPILQRFLTGTFVENTRRAAAEGLGKIEDNRAVNILLAQYDAEESYGVQGAIKEALKSSPLAEEVADAIAARLIRIPRGILPDSEDFPGALFYVLYDLADTSKVDTTYAVGLFDKIESDSSNQEVKDRAKKLGERLKNELAKKT